ncbi:fusicoccadiene synthase [Annulohypoxylon stygium]|nr:fusicoccadiene synthase [Annulohypoxylon stygium]
MEYQYSEEIDQDLYDLQGLGIGVPLRMHKDFVKEIEGTLRLQRDWNKYISQVDGYNGGLGHRFHFMSATIPECLPDRLEVISYANEFAFLYDDEMEKLDIAEYSKENSGILDTFHRALDRKIEPHARPEKKIQAKILEEMLAIDPPRAAIMMNSWATFVQSASRSRTLPYETLEEYVPARVIDAGELIWFGFLTFGMALTIPDEEYELCNALAKPAYAALGLTNDLYSWEKERLAAENSGQGHVFNVIWVIMKERSVGEEKAKSICRAEIKKQITAYCRVVDGVLNNPSMHVSKDLQTYLQALLHSYVGNIAWSFTCPRYQELEL